MKITAEKFVREWQLTNSTLELSEKLGIKTNTLATRAKRYRHKGIPLKTHRRTGRPSLDVAKLILIASETE